MQNLDIDQSVRAIFALCSDVSKLTVHGAPYFYFKPERRCDTKILKYIFKRNNISAEAHLTHYYTNNKSSDLVVRVPVSELEDCPQEFKKCLSTAYKDKTDFAGCGLFSLDSKPVLFSLWPAYKKQKFIYNIADRTR